MASLLSIFTEGELGMILEALNAREKHCMKQANSPIRGYGKASEFARKEDWANKAQVWRDLENKVAAEID